MKILFNNPKIDNQTLRGISLLNKKKIITYSIDGEYENKCKSFLKKKFKSKNVLLTKSCTAALEIISYLINIKKNDEIIFPNFTYFTSVSPFVTRGAKPILCDINSKTLNINFEDLLNKIKKKTKAIVLIHYAGIPSEMDKIKSLCKSRKIILIEDAANAIFSKFNNKLIGTFGDFSTFSFHQTKNIHCGEGGALLINSNKYANRANNILHKGTNRINFDHGKIKKYTWVDYGSSYNLGEINCKILFESLKKYSAITNFRRKIFFKYNKELKILEDQKFIQRPYINKKSYINGNSYFILVKKNIREKIMKYLEKNKIHTTFHYQPISDTPFYKKRYKNIKNLNCSIDTSKQIIRLPMHNYLKDRDIEYITKYIKKFFLK